MMWFFRHFWIFISYHIFLLNQVEGAIAIPPSNSAPLPLFCPSICPSVCPSIGLLTTFSGFCTFADKSLGRNGIELEMQMFPDDLPLANIDADGYCSHFMRSSVRPTIHGLCISIFKTAPSLCQAYLTHITVTTMQYLQILHCMAINNEFLNSQGQASKVTFMYFLDINYWPHFCPLVQPFRFFFFLLFFSFFFLRLGLGKKRAVVIIGRWLLPSLVDTGDICCHYWQHILVQHWFW